MGQIKNYYIGITEKSIESKSNIVIGDVYEQHSDGKPIKIFQNLEDYILDNNSPTNRFFLVETKGRIYKSKHRLYCTSVKILKEIERSELEDYMTNKNIQTTRKFLALYSNNEKTLKRLLFTRDDVVLNYLAQNPFLPMEMFEELLQDSKRHIYIAKNLGAPEYIFEKLIHFERSNVLVELATNPNSSQDILAKLVETKNIKVITAVAGNNNTSETIIEQIYKDFKNLEPWFYANIAKNPNTPQYILDELLTHSHAGVRGGLCFNPKVSTEVLEYLLKDPEPKVRKIAQDVISYKKKK